jgi:hypothetical protein
MTDENRDLMLRRLSSLAVLQPDSARSERVRRRCRAALDRGRGPDAGLHAPARVHRPALVSALTYALSAGLVVALVQDLVRVYWRR